MRMKMIKSLRIAAGYIERFLATCLPTAALYGLRTR